MQETTDAAGPSRRTRQRVAEPPATDRNSHRTRGWLIAVGASALLWGLIVGVVWSVVAAVT